jgi:nuclear distribution NudE-like protein 1
MEGEGEMYWKSQAEEWKSRYEESQENLKEFQESSRELEGELEKELVGLESRYKDAVLKIERLTVELEDAREKNSALRSEMNQSVGQLQKQLQDEQSSIKVYKERTRELELDNDDLQSLKRVTSTSLEDLELKYNRMMERNAILEAEIDEKQSLVIEIQRLRDELNEMSDELSVARGAASVNENQTPVKNRRTIDLIESSAFASSTATATATASPSQLVHDITMRVKSLESRLFSCRKMIAPMLKKEADQ